MSRAGWEFVIKGILLICRCLVNIAAEGVPCSDLWVAYDDVYKSGEEFLNALD